LLLCVCVPFKKQKTKSKMGETKMGNKNGDTHFLLVGVGCGVGCVIQDYFIVPILNAST